MDANSNPAQSTQNSDKQRVRGRPFVRGQSGNPGGRPGKSPELRRIEDLAREHSEAAMLALVDEAQSGKGAPRVQAAIAILDRGWGKPIERQESGTPGAFAESREEIEARIKERSVRLGLAKIVPIPKAA